MAQAVLSAHSAAPVQHGRSGWPAAADCPTSPRQSACRLVSGDSRAMLCMLSHLCHKPVTTTIMSSSSPVPTASCAAGDCTIATPPASNDICAAISAGGGDCVLPRCKDDHVAASSSPPLHSTSIPDDVGQCGDVQLSCDAVSHRVSAASLSVSPAATSGIDCSLLDLSLRASPADQPVTATSSSLVSGAARCSSAVSHCGSSTETASSAGDLHDESCDTAVWQNVHVGGEAGLATLSDRQSSLQLWNGRLLKRLRALQCRSLRRQVVERLDRVSSQQQPQLAPPCADDTTIVLHHLSRLQTVVDSDVTESSSGSELSDIEQDQQSAPQQQQHSHRPSTHRVLYNWTRDRARLAARWQWLLAQINQLDARIHQLNTLHADMRSTRLAQYPLDERDAGSLSHTNTDTCARVRALCTRRQRLRRRVVHVARHAPAPRAPAPRAARGVVVGGRVPLSACACSQCEPASGDCVACIGPAVRAGGSLLAGNSGRDRWRPLLVSSNTCTGARQLLNSAGWRKQHLYQARPSRTTSTAGDSHNKPASDRQSCSRVDDSSSRASVAGVSAAVPAQSVVSQGGACRSHMPHKRGRRSCSVDEWSHVPDTHNISGDRPAARRSDSVDHGGAGGGSRQQLVKHHARRSSFDIDNVVLPPGLIMCGRIERLQCKDIATPGWRRVSVGVGAAVNGSQASQTENMSDAEFERRHASYQLAERRRICQQVTATTVISPAATTVTTTTRTAHVITQASLFESRRFPLCREAFNKLMMSSSSSCLPPVKRCVSGSDVKTVSVGGSTSATVGKQSAPPPHPITPPSPSSSHSAVSHHH